MRSDKVSVIIPTYNRAHMVKAAIESVMQQSYENLEILIVDDGSTDATGEVVESLQDDRIIYLKQPKNKGAANARNKGVKHATAEYIAFQDSDDFWLPQKLEKQMEYMKNHPEYDMVYCPFLAHTPTEDVRFPTVGMQHTEGRLFHKLIVHNLIGTPTMLLSKKGFLDCGGFDETWRSIEDWDFAIRFSRKYMIGYVNEVLVEANYMDNKRLSADIGAFYEGRLRMIASYKDELMQSNQFDQVVMEVFQRAEREGLLKQVQQMFMLMLR